MKLHEQYFIDLLNVKNGVSSHDTFSRVFSSIDSKKFTSIFIEWIKDIVKQKRLHVAIDGKANKSARDKLKNVTNLIQFPILL